MAYDPTIYLGSAAHYRYGRPAYSPELETVLRREAGLDGNGRLLDVGCGPGVLTVRLAHLFEQTVGLDPDADMLAEGRRAADEKRVKSIRWVQGLAEDLPAVAPGPYRLVTFGQSFHWTDEQLVAEASRGSSSSPASPTCCEIARASCPATSPSQPRRRTCSVIGLTTSLGKCGRRSRTVLLRVFLGLAGRHRGGNNPQGRLRDSTA